MAASIDERNSILQMVATGQVSADEAAQLLDTLDCEHVQVRSRMIRVRVTDLTSRRQKINVTFPVGLIHVGLRLGARLAPRLTGSALEDLLDTISTGVAGRLLDLHDLEEGERIEIFVE